MIGPLTSLGLGVVRVVRRWLGRILRAALDRLQVHCRHLAATVFLEVEADALVLAKRAHSRALDRADVDEGVIAAAVRRDEAVAFVFVEEFNGAVGHSDFLLWRDRSAGPLRARRDKRRKRGAFEPLVTVKWQLVAGRS